MAGHVKTPGKTGSKSRNFTTAAAARLKPRVVRRLPPRHDDPDVGALVPRPAAIVAEDGLDGEAGALELPRHLRHGERAKREIEPVLPCLVAAPFHVPLLEGRQAARRVLADRLD